MKNSTTTDLTDNCQLVPFSRIVDTTYNASQDQYTFGGRLTDHQTCDRHTYAADARRSQRGQKPNSTAALCPTTIRVPLLHCCISKLAVCSQALGALRAAAARPWGHSTAKFQAQGYRDKSGTVAFSKTSHSAAESMLIVVLVLVLILNGIYGVTFTDSRARGLVADCQTKRTITLREMARPDSSERVPSGHNSGLPNGQPGRRRVIAARGA